jgi:hypothetical protein
MWPMTCQVSLLVAIVGLIDVLGRKRAWPQVLCALWLLVFVKLVLPRSLALHPGSPHITGKSANGCAV